MRHGTCLRRWACGPYVRGRGRGPRYRREALGVIPKTLVDRETSYTGLTDLRVVGSVNERKALMSEPSEGFVAWPSGSGTLEGFRDPDLGAARRARKAPEPAQPRWLLRSAARLLRPHGRKGLLRRSNGRWSSWGASRNRYSTPSPSNDRSRPPSGSGRWRPSPQAGGGPSERPTRKGAREGAPKAVYR
jgi:Possible lysine decarboxylase